MIRKVKMSFFYFFRHQSPIRVTARRKIRAPRRMYLQVPGSRN